MRNPRTIAIVALLLFVPIAISASNDVKSPLLTSTDYVPDIATFMLIGANTPTGYSWDGNDVYFLSSMTGAKQVFRLSDGGWPHQLTTFEDGIDFFTLSHNGTMAVVGASIGGSEQSQLFLVDAQTGMVVQLTFRPDVQRRSVKWSPDDRSIYYRSNEENKRDFFIYRMDITSREKAKVFGDEGSGYNSVADLSSDGNWLLIYRFTSSTTNDLFLIDLGTGESTQLNNDDGSIAYEHCTIMPDNKSIWMSCNQNDDGILRLAKMTIGSPKPEFIDGWVDSRWGIDSLAFSRDFKYLAIEYNENGYIRLKLRDIVNNTELRSPPRDGQVDFGGFNRKGHGIVGFAGPTRAPDCGQWDPVTGNFKQLTFATYAGIDRNLFAEPSLVHFRSFDSLEIPAFLYLPGNYTGNGPIPFVVYAHGGPSSQFKPGFTRNFQYMMLNGYGILAVNPRGSSGYGIEYMSLDDYKKRKHSLADYKAATDFLIANGYTEKGMMGIVGGSYGGYVVLGMITEYPDLFSAAIDNAGIANFKTFLERTKSYRRHLREAEYGPLTDPEFLESISPTNKAHLIKTPLLVIHGENDPRVPVHEARLIISKVSEAGGIVDSLIFPDEGHGTSKRPNIITRYRRQVEFFNSYLKNRD